MLTLANIAQFFPEEVQTRKKGMLREYLQYLILQVIFTSQFRDKLVFLGGTCLRIVYNSGRFSEDLDFDNRGLTQDDFGILGDIISRRMTDFGCQCEVKMAFKGAFHCYLRIPKILYDYGLSGYEDEKILIQIDTVPQPFAYEPSFFTLAKFGCRETLAVTSREILLAQKIVAAYSRKKIQGRDFFDIQYLLSWNTTPSYEFLEKTSKIHNADELRTYMLEKNQAIDFDKLAHDVEPFLFRSEDVKMVRDFAKMTEIFLL